MLEIIDETVLAESNFVCFTLRGECKRVLSGSNLIALRTLLFSPLDLVFPITLHRAHDQRYHSMEFEEIITGIKCLTQVCQSFL